MIRTWSYQIVVALLALSLPVATNAQQTPPPADIYRTPPSMQQNTYQTTPNRLNTRVNPNGSRVPAGQVQNQGVGSPLNSGRTGNPTNQMPSGRLPQSAPAAVPTYSQAPWFPQNPNSQAFNNQQSSNGQFPPVQVMQASPPVMSPPAVGFRQPLPNLQPPNQPGQQQTQSGQPQSFQARQYQLSQYQLQQYPGPQNPVQTYRQSPAFQQNQAWNQPAAIGYNNQTPQNGSIPPNNGFPQNPSASTFQQPMSNPPQLQPFSGNAWMGQDPQTLGANGNGANANPNTASRKEEDSDQTAEQHQPTTYALQNSSGLQNITQSGVTNAQHYSPNLYFGPQFQNWNNISTMSNSPASYNEMGRYQPGPFSGYVAPNTYMGSDFSNWNNLTPGTLTPGMNGGWNYSAWP